MVWYGIWELSRSSLWDLFSNDVITLESTFNLSMKIMWNVPRETHRYFIEYLSNQKHLRFILIKRFLRFIQQIEKSSKSAIKSLLSICKYDCRSTTGKNLRQLMIMSDKYTIDSIEESDFDSMEYCPVPEGDTWRIGILDELLDSRSSIAEIPGFTQEEIQDLIDFVCVS